MAADITIIDTAPAIPEAPSPLKAFWITFSENRGAVVGMLVLAAIIILAVFAEFIAPYSPIEQFRQALEGLGRKDVPLLYTAGFMVATGLLHVGGIVLGLAVRWPTGAKVVRGIGALISLAGVGFLTGTL